MMPRRAAASRMGKRIAALERERRVCPAQQLPDLAADDAEFFEHMLARAQIGDRDWSDDDRTRYHAILLAEPYP